MSWKEDLIGEKYTNVSLYDKDCLPTWDELYHEFYKKKIFEYDSNNSNHLESDPYWNRPRRKMLLAWVCNQLNKLVFEDKMDVLPFIDKTFGGKCEKIQFILLPSPSRRTIRVLHDAMLRDGPPSIYSCRIPSTGNFSIFSSNYPRIDIDDKSLERQFELVCLLYHPASEEDLHPADREDLLRIIEYLLSNVIQYFENGVGWKDKDNRLLPSQSPNHNCQGAGIDPAL